MAMSKRLESPALLARLHTVAGVLSSTQAKTTRAKIDQWLDDHEELLDPLWNLMESNLLVELVTRDGEKKLPKSCTRFGLIPDTERRELILKGNPSITSRVLKLAVQVDPKIKQKFIQLDLGLTGAEALKGGISHSSFLAATAQRREVLGGRLKSVEVGNDGKVDWQTCGIYLFAKKSVLHEDDDSMVGEAQFKLLHNADKDAATHVYHRFAKQAISLEQLGLGKVNAEWHFTKNWAEKEAQLSNGKRLRVDLWEDFKTMDGFLYDAMHKEKFPNNAWFANFGEEAKRRRMKDIELAQEAAAAAREAKDQAGVSMVQVPKKARKRL